MTRRAIRASVLLALSTGMVSAQQVLINGAGATFPYPMYSKWFDEYHKKFPTIQFNYQSIGVWRWNPTGYGWHSRFRSH
jgi:phosphate transport system substrate-binding protein